MSVVLITGSCGLVGSESVKFFIKKGFEVVGIDNNYRMKFFGRDGNTSWVKKNLINSFKYYKHYSVDIRNYTALEKIFKKFKKSIKLIIHSAAQPSHDWSKTMPFVDFGINASGTLNLLELTKKYSYEAPFIFMSTNKVYGDSPNNLPLIEKSTRWEIPKNHKFYNGIDEKMSVDKCVHTLFGASKLYADIAVQEYGKNIGLKTVCFRAGCITGPNHSGAELHGFLSYLVKATLTKKKYFIFGYKGKQVRDNMHSQDLVRCFWEYYKNPKKKGEVYNIGGSRFSSCSVIEALNTVEKVKKIKIKKKYIKKSRTGDHIWWISDIRKFKKEYPKFKLNYNSQKIIREMIKFYSKKAE